MLQVGLSVTPPCVTECWGQTHSDSCLNLFNSCNYTSVSTISKPAPCKYLEYLEEWVALFIWNCPPLSFTEQFLRHDQSLTQFLSSTVQFCASVRSTCLLHFKNAFKQVGQPYKIVLNRPNPEEGLGRLNIFMQHGKTACFKTVPAFLYIALRNSSRSLSLAYWIRGIQCYFLQTLQASPALHKDQQGSGTLSIAKCP